MQLVYVLLSVFGENTLVYLCSKFFFSGTQVLEELQGHMLSDFQPAGLCFAVSFWGEYLSLFVQQNFSLRNSGTGRVTGTHAL